MVDQWMHWVTDDWETLQPGDYEEHAGLPTTATTSSSGNASSSESGKQLESSQAATVTAATNKQLP